MMVYLKAVKRVLLEWCTLPNHSNWLKFFSSLISPLVFFEFLLYVLPFPLHYDGTVQTKVGTCCKIFGASTGTNDNILLKLLAASPPSHVTCSLVFSLLFLLRLHVELIRRVFNNSVVLTCISCIWLSNRKRSSAHSSLLSFSLLNFHLSELLHWLFFLIANFSPFSAHSTTFLPLFRSMQSESRNLSGCASLFENSSAFYFVNEDAPKRKEWKIWILLRIEIKTCSLWIWGSVFFTFSNVFVRRLGPPFFVFFSPNSLIFSIFHF